MKKILTTFFIVLLFVFTPITNSDNSEWVFQAEEKTIMELKDNINELEKKDDDIEDKYDELNTDYRIKTFLKKDLTLIELNKIRRLVKQYNTNNSFIELALFDKVKKWISVVEERRLLLEEKRKLYSWLIPYIDSKYDDDYVEYIKWDAKLFHEKEDLKEDKIIKQEILDNKVEMIETKIQEHRDFINESIKKIIETRLDEKISNLSNNETFIKLPQESKIKVLDKTIWKIVDKLVFMKENANLTLSWSIKWLENSPLNKKIQTYNIAVKKLEIFRDTLINEK